MARTIFYITQHSWSVPKIFFQGMIACFERFAATHAHPECRQRKILFYVVKFLFYQKSKRIKNHTDFGNFKLTSLNKGANLGELWAMITVNILVVFGLRDVEVFGLLENNFFNRLKLFPKSDRMQWTSLLWINKLSIRSNKSELYDWRQYHLVRKYEHGNGIHNWWVKARRNSWYDYY